MAKRYQLKRVDDGGDPTILDGLNAAQREAAAYVDGPLLILAGAGSGKTRVITHRIAHMVRNEGVSPDQILAVTFTNKAAGEMRERVDELLEGARADDAWRVTISTFHSLCARLLRQHGERLGLDRHFVIYDDSDQRALIKRVLADRGSTPSRGEISRLRDVIERHKNAARTPAQAHEEAHDSSDEEDAFFYEEYQSTLRASNCVDFGDLILGVLEMCRDDPTFASKLSNRWRYVMVDEFQDTNPSQYELLRHLTTEHANLCVVGDDDQSIYRWRGATIANILGFDGDFEATKIVKLEQNYRSTQVILDAANDIIQLNAGRRPKTLWTDRAGGEPVTTFAGADDREEAMWVAGTVERLRGDGVEYPEMAVFYRTNAQARSFEEQLRFAGVPYQIVGGLSFYAREEVKDLLAYLKVALNPLNEVDLVRILNKPTRGIGQTSQDKLRVAAALPEIGSLWRAISWTVERSQELFVDESLAALASLSSKPASGIRKFHAIVTGLREQFEEETNLAQIVAQLLNTLDFTAHLEKTDSERAEDKLRNVHELVNAIDEFQRTDGVGLPPLETLRQFLDRSALLASTDAVDDRLGAVTLMTVHSSKGLEFDTVFLAGMEDGLFPSRREGTVAELEEERRLAYVAITRAKRKLYVSFAHRRRRFGEYQDQTQSEFLHALDPDRLELDPRSVKPSRQSGRASYGRGDGGKSWRRQNIGRGHNDWEFDQSEPMVRGAITRALGEDLPTFDEFSQETQWDELADDVWAAPPDASDALVGKHCSHSKLGPGQIVSVSGEGDHATLTIEFATGRKTVQRKWVKVYG